MVMLRICRCYILKTECIYEGGIFPKIEYVLVSAKIVAAEDGSAIYIGLFETNKYCGHGNFI